MWCSASVQGAAVVAARLEDLALRPCPSAGEPAGQLPRSGSVRLADSVIWGFCMARHTNRRGPKACPVAHLVRPQSLRACHHFSTLLKKRRCRSFNRPTRKTSS